MSVLLRIAQPLRERLWISILLVGQLCLIAACGGGGGGGGGQVTPPANRTPTANAGPDSVVDELTTISLDGSGSTDPDSNALSYSWTQTGGNTVTLNNATQAVASFDAPNVAVGTEEEFTFQLIVNDGSLDSGADTVVVTVVDAPTMVTISGNVQYEFVPVANSGSGLDFNNIMLRPIRQATVQALAANGVTVLAAGTTDDNGDYALTVPSLVNVSIRVLAETTRSGPPSWDIVVKDNTRSSTGDVSDGPRYALDGTSTSSGYADSVRNLTAQTGWTGTSYGATRAAAPFAVFDTIYSAVQLVVSAEPAAHLFPLEAFWSVNNKTATGGDLGSGEIGTTFYSDLHFAIFVLGEANVDTDEFDDHVIAHEWGHFFEFSFSRSDSIGGLHIPDDYLDMRVAFGEGWGNAFSGMVLDDPLYVDTMGAQQSGGFNFDLETASPANPGWYSEASIQNVLYDLWDTNNDGVDTGSVGFDAIFDVLDADVRTNTALTSIFSFATALKANNPARATLINNLLAQQNINGAAIDSYGSNEVNDAGAPDVLPVYTTIDPDGTVVNVCSNSQFDRTGGTLDITGNKLSEYRFLRLNVGVESRYLINVDTTTPIPPGGARTQSDPDIFLTRRGLDLDDNSDGVSGDLNHEDLTTINPLAVGEYIIALLEIRFTDPNTPNNFPARVCYDVSVTPAP